MILMIDNYDSFTFNLVQYLEQLNETVLVFRNDQISIPEINHLKPDAIVFSPGPGRPEKAGRMVEIIEQLHSKTPMLGICLGHQAISYAFGGHISKAPTLMHGKSSEIMHDEKSLFQQIPNPFPAARYHSLIVTRENLPACLEITAHTENGDIMGIRHKDFLVEGVQFHPESILTVNGKRILKNFLNQLPRHTLTQKEISL